MAVIPLGYSIEEAKRMIPCGHTKIYELIGEGRLVARKLGRKTIVTAESLHRLVGELPLANVRAENRLMNEPAKGGDTLGRVKAI
jgi:hypothetical protein